MAIKAFYIFFLLFTALFIYLFDAFSMDGTSVILWFVSLVPAFFASVGVMVLALYLYGRIHVKDADPFDMRHHAFANSIMALILKIARLDITVTGEENIPKEPFVLASNHQTLFDILAMKTIISDRPLIFIAKRELFQWPVVGRVIALLGNVPIERESDRSAAQAIIEGIKMHEKGAPVMVFPEGHRARKNEMIPFKPGSFKLAMKPKAKIVVACVHDMHKALKGWPFLRQKARVHFHAPLEAKDYEGMSSHELSETVKRTIQAKLDEFASRA